MNEKDVHFQKKNLRLSFMKKRAGFALTYRQNMDKKIAENLQSIRSYRSCDLLLPYLSFKSEVGTHLLVNKALNSGIRVAIPKCIGQEMFFIEITSIHELRPGKFGILEPPSGSAVLPTDHSVCLVPALSFDINGMRLGYGGGYYDRFLKSYPGTAIGLCYAPLFSKYALPVEKHDCGVNFVVTDQKVIKINE